MKSGWGGQMAFRGRRAFLGGELGQAALCLAGVIVAAMTINSALAPPSPAAMSRASAERDAYGGRPSLEDPVAASAFMDTLARKCEGDFKRLPDLDQRWMNSACAGHGEIVIRSRYASMKAAEAKKAKTAKAANPMEPSSP